MSMQRTAQSALHALEELYKVLDSSNQQYGQMTIDDSENLVHALCSLSQLINHINQTGMCGPTTNIHSNRFDRRNVKTFINPHLADYDENMIMDSATIGLPPQTGQPYGECILYHPIRIITTGADSPTVLHETDFSRKGYEHSKRFPHRSHTKKSGRGKSRSRGRSSKSVSRASRSGSRGSRMSRRSRRSSRGRASYSRGRSSRSSRRISSSHRSKARSSRNSRSSRSGHRRSHSHGRRSRSSRKGSRNSRSSQRRSQSRRRSSHKRRSKQYQHQIPSHPISTTTNPTTQTYPLNQMGSTSLGNQQSIQQQPYVRSLPSAAPIITTSNAPLQPPPLYTPTIPLLPPPAISALHHSHPSSQMPMPSSLPSLNNIPLSSIIHGNNTPFHRSITNPLNDQPTSYQQVPMSTISTGNTTLLQQPSLSPMLNIPTSNGTLSSNITPLQTTNNTFTSHSDNCPECRAITRLLQWAPLKCYDAAGIRRGVFLAGPKSEKLLKALYASIKDSSLSLDDIEDCLCDNE